MEPVVALDLFAGTGWGVACQRLGIEERGVELMAEAVATRTANGMETVYRDVWQGILLSREMHELLYGIYNLLIGSPPCQTFSVAGNGAGRKALNEVIEAIRLHAYKDPQALLAFGEKHDMRTALVLTPLAYVYRDRPRYVALEQVPTVLPVWEACAEIMREMGYSVKTAVLQAEQYGVPQTRKRAILVARLDGEVQLPAPTHSRYYSANPTKLDHGVAKWVSMAEALGWGMNSRPYPTIATGTEGGGTDPAALGGSGARKGVYAERARPGAWEPSGDVDNDGGILRLTADDAATLQTYPSSKDVVFCPTNLRPNAGLRTGDRPATTLAFGHDAPRWLTHDEVADYRTTGAPQPGVKLTREEISTLQTYPPFQWCGGKSKVFLQIGNAVPPLLAWHVLRALTQEPGLI